MSRQLKVILLCGATIAAARLIAQLDGPWVLVAAALGIAAFVGITMGIRRQYQKERPKPPWPPDDSVGS